MSLDLIDFQAELQARIIASAEFKELTLEHVLRCLTSGDRALLEGAIFSFFRIPMQKKVVVALHFGQETALTHAGNLDSLDRLCSSFKGVLGLDEVFVRDPSVCFRCYWNRNCKRWVYESQPGTVY